MVGMLLPGVKMLDLRNILSYTSLPTKEEHSEYSNRKSSRVCVYTIKFLLWNQKNGKQLTKSVQYICDKHKLAWVELNHRYISKKLWTLKLKINLINNWLIRGKDMLFFSPYGQMLARFLNYLIDFNMTQFSWVHHLSTI